MSSKRVERARLNRTKTALRHLSRRAWRRAKRSGHVRTVKLGKPIDVVFGGLSPGQEPTAEVLYDNGIRVVWG